ASILHADGTTEPLGTYHVHATELTVGPQGPLAMPGDLPPSSGYTYAVDITVDEAAGARSVVFSTPVSIYVQNFLGFPVGESVPVGFYDPSNGQWVGADSGRIIEILSVAGGLATIDTDGDGIADDAQSIGITTEERAQLADLYGPGTSLWRV